LKTKENVELYNINIVPCPSKCFFYTSVIIKYYTGQEISLFSIMFKVYLGPTHSLVKRYSVSFPEVKRPEGGGEVDHSPPSSVDTPATPARLHDVGKGTFTFTLPLHPCKSSNYCHVKISNFRFLA